MADLIPLAYDKASGVPVGLKEYAAADRIPAQYLTAQPPNLFGTYASRPAASAVTVGSLYWASDTKEIYRSDGSAWSRVGITSGRIASAELTTPYSISSSTPTAIPGMTLQITAGEVPASVQYGGTMKYGTTSANGVVSLYCDGTVIGSILIGLTGYNSFAALATIPAKTPGSLVNLELRAYSQNGTSALDIFGNIADKPYMRVVPN